MSHTVAVGQFEGPLGLLLELVERQKMPVSDISVGAITKEYLERVHDLQDAHVEDLSEFLQLGARLLYIKSLALLPAGPEGDQANELEQLKLELAEYRRFKAAASLLAERARSARSWERPAAKITAADRPLPSLTLQQLAEAFSRALQTAPTAPETAVIKPHLSLENVTASLRRRLSSERAFDLHDIISGCRDRLEIVVTFLAILELVRGGAVTVNQAGQFDPIRVEAARA